MSARRPRAVVLAALALAAAACDSVAARERPPAASPRNWRPVTMGHGITVGTQVSEIVLDCDGGARTPIAPRRGIQLITVATPQDCSSCAPHLASLDSLRVHGALPRDDAMVMWMPGADLARDVARVREQTPRTVCVDARGSMWDRYDLQHTPVTLLLVDGRVAYMNDRMLSTEAERAAFLQDLATHSAR